MLQDILPHLGHSNLHSNTLRTIPSHRDSYFHHTLMALGLDIQLDMGHHLVGTNLPSSTHTCQFLHHRYDPNLHHNKVLETLECSMLQDILPPWGHSSLPTNIHHPIHCHKACYFHHIELALGWHTLVDMKIQLADKNLPSSIQTCQFPCHRLCCWHRNKAQQILECSMLQDIPPPLGHSSLRSNILHSIPCHRVCYFHRIEMALGWDKLVDMDSQVTGTNLPSSIHACQFLHHKPGYPHHIEMAAENSMPQEGLLQWDTVVSHPARSVPSHVTCVAVLITQRWGWHVAHWRTCVVIWLAPISHPASVHVSSSITNLRVCITYRWCWRLRTFLCL